jgi:hypothetical protein
MELLNLYRKNLLKYLSALMVGKYLFLSFLQADVIQFFDPVRDFSDRAIKVDFKSFIANDPIELKELFDKWQGRYSPKDGKNIALLDSRFDLGGYINGLYIGYFYQYNAFIDTVRDFTDLVYSTKNKLDLQKGREYDLSLDIDGIKQYGLLLSKNGTVYENDRYRVVFGGGVYLSYGLDMQSGWIKGSAVANAEKDYDIDAYSSYYYTRNYLYRLDVEDSYGIGYGSHVGFLYTDLIYSYSFKFLVNDLFSYVKWRNLPYSKVDIKTQNKSYDEDGYLKYSPSIRGLEVYKNFTQKIDPSYKLQLTSDYKDIRFALGVDRKYDVNFPYFKIGYGFDARESFEIVLESRFKTAGFIYRYKDFNLNFSIDRFSDFKAIGFSSGLGYRF